MAYGAKSDETNPIDCVTYDASTLQVLVIDKGQVKWSNKEPILNSSTWMESVKWLSLGN